MKGSNRKDMAERLKTGSVERVHAEMAADAVENGLPIPTKHVLYKINSEMNNLGEILLHLHLNIL